MCLKFNNKIRFNQPNTLFLWKGVAATEDEGLL